VRIEQFSLALKLRRYKQILDEVGVFLGWVGHLKRKLQVEGDIAHQSRWWRSTVVRTLVFDRRIFPGLHHEMQLMGDL